MPSVLGPQLNARALQVSGLPGATSGVGRFAGCVNGAAPTTGTFALGDFVLDLADGTYWVCLTAGSPGFWTQIGVLSDAFPQPVGISAINPWGTAGTASRADHVHTLGTNSIVPLGIVAYNVAGAQTTTAGSELIGVTCTAALSASRCYEVYTSEILGQSSAGTFAAPDFMNVFLRQSAAGGSVGTGSTAISQNVIACPVANNIRDGKRLYALLNAPSAGTYQFGFGYARLSGSGNVSCNNAASRPLEIVVKDIGPALGGTSP